MKSPGTFSILARSPESGLLGVAVASGSTSVGNRVPHARPGVGVVVTQALTNRTYGVKGLELMGAGASPQKALDELLREDPWKEFRQVAFMNAEGDKAFFTGGEVPGLRGELDGKNYVVIGNMLACEEVLTAMATEFERLKGSIAERIVRALRIASASGGDMRGERSAALMVVSAKRVEVAVMVDEHRRPIEELYKKLKSARRDDELFHSQHKFEKIQAESLDVHASPNFALACNTEGVPDARMKLNR